MESTVTVINPHKIAEGEAQNVNADLTKFDNAKAVVANTLTKLATCLIIRDKAHCDDVMVTLKQASSVSSAIEKKRTELVKPFNDAVKKINTYAKELTGQVEASINTVKQVVLDWNKEEAKKAHQAMITARQAQLAQMGFIFNADANEYVLDDIKIQFAVLELSNDEDWNNRITSLVHELSHRHKQQVEVLEEDIELIGAFGTEEDLKQVTATKPVADLSNIQAVKTQTVAPVKGTTKRWTFEITDASLVPNEYRVVDEVAIRKAVMDGERNIPGVRIFQNESLTLR